MKRKLTQSEYEIVIKEITRIGLNEVRMSSSIDNTYVNGITVFETNDSPEGVYISYIEDDLVDEEGNPYIFDYPYYKLFGELKSGSRLIALYIENSYYILPANDESLKLVGAECKEGQNEVDKTKSVKLPTPLVFNLPKQAARLITEDDKRDIEQVVKKNGKVKVLQALSSVALSFLCIMIIGLIYIFTMAAIDGSNGKLGKVPFFMITAVALLLIGLGIFRIIVFMKSLYLRKLLKMNYIKQVMYCGIETTTVTHLYVPSFKCIHTYEWIGNELKHNKIPINNPTLFLDKNIQYGDIIYMLTGKPDEELKLTHTRFFISK